MNIEHNVIWLAEYDWTFKSSVQYKISIVPPLFAIVQ